MNIQEALDQIEGWLEENADEGYVVFEVDDNVDTLTITAEEE